MKKSALTFLALCCATIALFAQNPEAFQYQAIARDAGGDAISNQTVGVQFQLHQTTAGGTVVYSESHTPTTNEHGLFSVEVGNGTPSVGTFAAIDWSAGPYFMEVGMDPTGGSSYTSMGTQQLMSVPYALYATDVANKDDADADPANELQTISLVNDSIELSDGGGKLDLSSLKDDGDWTLDGDSVTTMRRVGIGTDAPDTTLHIMGEMIYEDGSEGEGLILTSDSEGNASWQNLSSQAIFGIGNIPQADLSCLSTLDSFGIGSNPLSVAISGNYTYVVDQGSDDLKVIDISNPAAPALSGSLGLGISSYPASIAVSGNYAYVVDRGYSDLKVVNISNPAAPALEGSLGIGSYASSVAVSGNYAYVVDYSTDDLKVIDISNPAAPTLSGSLGIGTGPQSVALSGNYAYVVDASEDDLKVIDISNPAAPALSSSLGIGTWPKSVAVSGNFAYVVDWGSQDLKVINISNPAAPALAGSLGIGTSPNSVTVSGNYAYVIDSGSDDLKVIDISNPIAPVIAGSIGMGTFPTSAAVLGNYGFVVDNESEDLKVIKLFCSHGVTYNTDLGQISSQSLAWTQYGDDLSNANSGNIGIGTSTPLAALDVSSDIRANGLTIGKGSGNQPSSSVFGLGALGNNSGNNNTALGAYTLSQNASGSLNTAIGVNALNSNQTGSRNTAVGVNSLNIPGHSGSDNTAIGYNADLSSNGLSNATAIGANTVVSQSNSLVLGNNANVGIGISDPSQKLTVIGSAANGSILVAPDQPTDGNGGATSELLLAEDDDATFGVKWQYNGGDNKLSLFGFSNGIDYGPHLSIDRTSGNVGIGTSTPQENLHVQGNTLLDGTVKVNDKIQAADASGLKLATDDGTSMVYVEGGLWPSVGIAGPNNSDAAVLDVHGGIRSSWSGTTVVYIPPGSVEVIVTINGPQNYNDLYDTVALATVADGCYASVVTSYAFVNDIIVRLRNTCPSGGNTRINYIVFGLN